MNSRKLISAKDVETISDRITGKESLQIIHNQCGKPIEQCSCKDASVVLLKTPKEATHD